MGLTRKLISVSTVGLVPYRNAGERQARFAKQARNAARADVAQNAQLIELQRQQLAAQESSYVMQATQVAATTRLPEQLRGEQHEMNRAGWHTDPTDASSVTWWDGERWYPETKRAPMPGEGLR